LVVALVALVPIALTVAMRPAMYNGIRHFVFVLPPLAALGGWAGARALDWLARQSRYAFAAASIVISLALLPPIIDMVRLHPYQYTHFNRIAGGVSAANANYMLDYW